MAKEFTQRDQTQLAVFTRWINHHGEKAREPVQCKDMATDLTSGEALVLLSEVFVQGPQLKYSKAPKNKLQRTQNHSQALERFEKDGAELVNIHASTLADDEKDNLRVFMGLIWQLILRYSVSEAEMDAADAKKAKSLAELKKDLIDWVNSKLATLTPAERAEVRKFNGQDASQDELVVTNLEKDWQDGSYLTGLCIALHPEDKRQNGFNKLNDKVEQNPGENAAMAAAISRSTTNLTVPALMEAQELAHAPDQNAVITYVSAFKKAVYVDDSEPEAEKAQIDWDEPIFLQIEVDALEKRDLSTLGEQKDIIQSKLDEYNTNKANNVQYEASCDRKAVRMALHLRRVVATIANADADAASNADKDSAAKKAEEDAAAKDAEIDELNKKNKKAQEDAEEAAKKAAEEAEEAAKKAKKLQDDLDAANKELARLQKRQSKLEELQRALLACAEISDQMMEDENQ